MLVYKLLQTSNSCTSRSVNSTNPRKIGSGQIWPKPSLWLITIPNNQPRRLPIDVTSDVHSLPPLFTLFSIKWKRKLLNSRHLYSSYWPGRLETRFFVRPWLFWAVNRRQNRASFVSTTVYHLFCSTSVGCVFFSPSFHFLSFPICILRYTRP